MVTTPRGVTREVRGTPEIPPLAKAHPPSGPDTSLDIDDIPFVESQTSHESAPSRLMLPRGRGNQQSTIRGPHRLDAARVARGQSRSEGRTRDSAGRRAGLR